MVAGGNEIAQQTPGQQNTVIFAEQGAAEQQAA